MPTTTSPLTPATHGLRVAASFNHVPSVYRPANDCNFRDYKEACLAKTTTSSADNDRFNAF
jgi:hypothetical protein